MDKKTMWDIKWIKAKHMDGLEWYVVPVATKVREEMCKFLDNELNAGRIDIDNVDLDKLYETWNGTSEQKLEKAIFGEEDNTPKVTYEAIEAIVKKWALEVTCRNLIKSIKEMNNADQ